MIYYIFILTNPIVSGNGTTLKYEGLILVIQHRESKTYRHQLPFKLISFHIAFFIIIRTRRTIADTAKTPIAIEPAIPKAVAN